MRQSWLIIHSSCLLGCCPWVSFGLKTHWVVSWMHVQKATLFFSLVLSLCLHLIWEYWIIMLCWLPQCTFSWICTWEVTT
jgi:hypothetical protein